MANALTCRLAWQCDRAVSQTATTQPLPTSFPDNLQLCRGANTLLEIEGEDSGHDHPQSWNIQEQRTRSRTKYNGFPPRLSTNQRHSELHSPKEMEMEASRTRRAGPAQTIEKQGRQRGQRPTHATIQTHKRDKLTLMQTSWGQTR